MLSLFTAGRFRLLLALVVMFHHSLGFFGFGASAVYLFFALSGYWIARLWDQSYNRPAGPADLPRPAFTRRLLLYYFSRWLRLAPTLLFTIFLACILAFAIPETFTEEVKQSFSSLWWWCNTALIVGIPTQPLAIPPTWSLAAEMQFYLIFPLVYALLLRKKSALPAILAGSAIYGAYMMYSGHSPTSGNVFVYLSYFITGIASWQNRFPITRSWIYAGLALFAGIVLVTLAMPEWRHVLNNYSAGKTPEMLRLQNVYFYAATFLLTPLALSTVRNTSGPLDRHLGNLAYPLYLFHILPIGIYYQFRDKIPLNAAIVLGACWISCLIGSLAIYFLIDRPFEALRKKLVNPNQLKTHAS